MGCVVLLDEGYTRNKENVFRNFPQLMEGLLVWNVELVEGQVAPELKVLVNVSLELICRFFSTDFLLNTRSPEWTALQQFQTQVEILCTFHGSLFLPNSSSQV